MDESLIPNARAYAARYHVHFAERLGFGNHGNIFVSKSKSKLTGKTAIKLHHYPEPYHRERGVYERLQAACINKILGFNVPQLVRFDDELLVIEMTVVKRPFVLDFAGAYLDAPPEFPDETWADWEAAKREQFEHHWPQAQAILRELELLDIYMLDVTPANIAFLD